MLSVAHEGACGYTSRQRTCVPLRSAMYFTFFCVSILLTLFTRALEVSTSSSSSSSPSSSVKDKDDTTISPKTANGKTHQEHTANEKVEAASSVTPEFIRFQNNYLLVYLLAVAADWLQGPYVYALYTYYGYLKKEVGQLYIAGFASSAVFGTLIAAIADKFGRRSNALMYCVMYILSCATKHSPRFYVLLLGRIFGGIAYSILFSAFESWMVFEHTQRSFDHRWLSATFAKAQFGNGIVAILSGIVAGLFADAFGKVAPFDVSIFVLLVLMIVIATTWTENYGDATQSVRGSFARAWSSLISDERIVLLGVTQASFESAMYMFTFVWTPALQTAAGQIKEIPHGIIFATFMAATMMGSSLFVYWSRRHRVEVIMRSVFITGCAVFLLALASDDVGVTYVVFVVFEVLCGIYFPGIATMRAPYIPEESRSALLTFFRVPLNLIVVTALYEDLSIRTVFGMCAVLMLCAVISQTRLSRLARYAPVPTSPSATSHGVSYATDNGEP